MKMPVQLPGEKKPQPHQFPGGPGAICRLLGPNGSAKTPPLNFFYKKGIFPRDLASAEKVLPAVNVPVVRIAAAIPQECRVNFLIDVFTILGVWQRHFNRILYV
jgi:hypothetical protein